MKKYLFLATLITATMQVHGQPTSFGNMTCEEFASSPSPIKGAWVMGYLSGLNALHMISKGGKGADPLESIKPNEVFNQILARCDKAPSVEVSNAVWSLHIDLIAKTAK